MNFFDLRKLFPQRRQRSVREVYKGETACRRGVSLTQAESQKRAQRRVHRHAMTQATVDGLRENPAGSKLLRRFAKNAGFLVDEDGKPRKPTYYECKRWMAEREEARVRQGHQRARHAAPQAEILLGFDGLPVVGGA